MGVFPSGLSSRRKQSGSSGYTHRCHQPDNVTDAFTALQPRDNGCHQADEPVFRKKKKCCSLVSVRFVILLPGFVRMVEELPRSVRHVISFCNSRWSVLWYTLRYRFLFAFYMCKGQKPPAKTPPEACYNLFLICYLSPVSRNKEQKPCLWN